MDRRRKLTLEQERELLRRRSAGEAAQVLALEYGVSRKTVDDLLQQSLTPRARFSRRQLSHYLKLLGKEPPEPRRLVDGAAAGKSAAGSGRGRRRLNAETWALILRKHEEGVSYGALAEEYGISRNAVVSGLRRAQQPLVAMTLEHLEWLEGVLMPGGRRRRKSWTHAEVRRLLEERFGLRISLRTFRSQLDWMGMRSAGAGKTAARREERRAEKKRAREENERLVLKALESGALPLISRGRPKGRRKESA